MVKCAPLFLAESILTGVEDIARSLGPVVEIESFQRRRVALIAPAERLRGGAFDRAREALSNAVNWYGSSLDQVVAAEADLEALASAYHTVRHGGAELILAAGASGTDPLDVVFEGLRQAGGEVVQYGIPAEPGTACWIGRLGAVPVLGSRLVRAVRSPGALDLLLPRLFTGAALDQDMVRSLAFGGLLLGPSRIAPYHTSHLAASDRKRADEVERPGADRRFASHPRAGGRSPPLAAMSHRCAAYWRLGDPGPSCSPRS